MNIQDYTWQTFQEGDKVKARPLLTYATNKIIQYETLNLPSGQIIDGKGLELVDQYLLDTGEWTENISDIPATVTPIRRTVLRLKTQPIEGEKETFRNAFEDYPKLAEKLLHAANFWKTDYTWSSTLNEVNLVCQELTAIKSAIEKLIDLQERSAVRYKACFGEQNPGGEQIYQYFAFQLKDILKQLTTNQ